MAIIIALVTFVTIGGIGAPFLIGGLIYDRIKKEGEARCNRVTQGQVVRHVFYRQNLMVKPMVQYQVGGKTYEVSRKFYASSHRQTSRLFGDGESGAYEDERGWLHIKAGPEVDLGALAQDLWPLGSRARVYYNPRNPQEAYVDRPVGGGIMAKIAIRVGWISLLLGLVAAGLVFFFMTWWGPGPPSDPLGTYFE
ncbi:MAG: DUF3592 domain-containing protein [Tissierellia bacterium]|nr:DUF3592 domain-containing protein [Tissierellia bacterium]